jgi:hypothetical protein
LPRGLGRAEPLGQPAHHREERRVRQDVGAELQAGALERRRGLCRDELAHQPRLADAGHAADEDGGRTRLRRLLARGRELRQLGRTARKASHVRKSKA